MIRKGLSKFKILKNVFQRLYGEKQILSEYRNHEVPKIYKCSPLPSAPFGHSGNYIFYQIIY